MDVRLGAIHVINDKVSLVKARSGKSEKNGASIFEWGNDAHTTIIPLPRSTTKKDVIATNEKLGDFSLGIVPSRLGFALRVPVEEASVLKAKSLMDPALADATETLLNFAEDAVLPFKVQNLPSHLQPIGVVNMFNDIGWPVRFERFLPSNNKGSNDMLVLAKESPLDTCMHFGDGKLWVNISN